MTRPVMTRPMKNTAVKVGGFALGLLEEHMSHCFVEAAAAGGREADEKVREASEAIARLVRS